MKKINYRRVYAILENNKKRILKVNSLVPEASGIYILTRYEDNFKYAYIGQAKNILRRLADHLNGYQHIDLSLKKHGFYSLENPTGWHIDFNEYSKKLLDVKEQEYIVKYANDGYQLRNKTTGSQGVGKQDISDNITKGYQQGLSNGYNNAVKEITSLLAKVDFSIQPKKTTKGKDNSHSIIAVNKLKNILGV